MSGAELDWKELGKLRALVNEASRIARRNVIAFEHSGGVGTFLAGMDSELRDIADRLTQAFDSEWQGIPERLAKRDGTALAEISPDRAVETVVDWFESDYEAGKALAVSRYARMLPEGIQKQGYLALEEQIEPVRDCFPNGGFLGALE